MHFIATIGGVFLYHHQVIVAVVVANVLINA